MIPGEILIWGENAKKHRNAPKFGVLCGVGGDRGDFGEWSVRLFWGEKRELRGRGSLPRAWRQLLAACHPSGPKIVGFNLETAPEY